MVLLIHHQISPYCRKLRIAMSEKKILFGLKEETPWNLSADVYKLNPAGELPIFINDGHVISGHYPICEYLEEVVKENPLLESKSPFKHLANQLPCPVLTWSHSRKYTISQTKPHT